MGQAERQARHAASSISKACGKLKPCAKLSAHPRTCRLMVYLEVHM